MKRSRILILLMILPLALTGCGESSKLYPSSKADGVYFSVPKNWHTLSTATLNKYEKKAAGSGANSRQSLVKWQVAFSTDSKVKVSQVFSLTPPVKPLVFARVRDLTATEANSFSYNSLRNVIIPITQLTEGVDLGVSDFKVILDEEKEEKSARGVHTVYSFSINGTEQIFNQTVLMSNNHSTVYIFTARCKTSCYTKNKKLIEEIVNSYTVQGVQ